MPSLFSPRWKPGTTINLDMVQKFTIEWRDASLDDDGKETEPGIYQLCVWYGTTSTSYRSSSASYNEASVAVPWWQPTYDVFNISEAEKKTLEDYIKSKALVHKPNAAELSPWQKGLMEQMWAQPIKKMARRACQWCHAGIDYKSPRAKFCNKNCKDKYHNANNPRGYQAPRGCQTEGDTEDDF